MSILASLLPYVHLTHTIASGHSLGGGLAALVGTTFGTPVVAFESPGDKTAARRLHLPSPVRYTPLSSGALL